MRIKKDSDYIFSFKGLNEIEENSKFYSAVLNDYGLLCFRDAHLNDESSICALKSISKHFSWTPIPLGGNESWKYTQNYDGRIGSDEKYRRGSAEPAKLINTWHVEGVSMLNPQQAAGWNMRHFSCKKTEGRTGFVDASQILLEMPENMLKFLRKCMVIHYPRLDFEPESINEMVTNFHSSIRGLLPICWVRDGSVEKAAYPRAAISPHPSRGVEVLRVCPCRERWGVQDVLYSVDGNAPSEMQIKGFEEVILWLESKVDYKDNQWWHEWVEGDFVIPDLFVMIHSAEAGFDVGEREFDGFWCHQDGVGTEPNLSRPI